MDFEDIETRLYIHIMNLFILLIFFHVPLMLEPIAGGGCGVEKELTVTEMITGQKGDYAPNRFP